MSRSRSATAAAPPLREVGAGSAALFGVGSIGTGVFSTVPAVLLLYYCTEVLDVPAAWAAVIVFAPKAWAILWDPLVGAWSDRTAGPFGRRRPFLLAGAVGVTAAFVALFSGPAGASPLIAALWVGLTYFALATLYSVFAVPYIAVPAEIGREAKDRSRLVTWRMSFAMAGVLLGGAAAPALVEALGGGARGYAGMALILALICGAAMLGPVLMLGPHDPARLRPPPGSAPAASLRSQLGPALRHRPFRWLACAYLIQLTAVGALSSAAPYVVTRVLGRPEGDIAAALAALLLATTAALPVWGLAGRRFGEGRMLILGVVWYGLAAAALGAAAALHAPWPLILALFAFAGAPFAAAQVLPFVLLAHLVHDDPEGKGGEGVFTGIWTATEKLGLAIGPALTGLAISLGGGDPAKATPAMLMVLPLGLALLSLAPLHLSFRDRTSAP